jgi:tetratricopeptide (TPR) repeat protein
MRVIGLLLGLIVATGATVALRVLDDSRNPQRLAARAVMENTLDASRAVGLYREALRRDPANPYRWTDLGLALRDAGDIRKARYCYARALQLSGEIPQVWLRDANFRFQIGEEKEALNSAARVLHTVPDYDDVLFDYFDRLVRSTPLILSYIGNDRRATVSYTRHLIEIADIDDAALAWNQLLLKGYADDRMATSYTDALLRVHRYADAQREWVRYLNNRKGDYPDRNLLFNAGFETEPAGSAFDWRIQPSDDFETFRDNTVARDGQWSLAIRFHGTANVSYANVIQTARLLPGRYKLEAWVLTKEITTAEGPRLEISDFVSPSNFRVRTEPLTGTRPWTVIKQVVTIPSSVNLVAVRVVRDPSAKFDNKINGTLWLDCLKLTQE